MAFPKLLIIAVIIFLGNSIFAQNIKIKNIDNQDYPLIKVIIEFDGQEQVDINKLQIKENKELTVFSIDSAAKIIDAKVISILIDESILTEKSFVNNVLSSLEAMVKELNNFDKINVFLSKDALNSGNCLTLSSFEYTSDFQPYTLYLKSFINVQKSQAVKPQIGCAINELINFIQSKNFTGSRKIIFILSSTSSEENNGWDQLSRKAQNIGIELIKPDINIFQTTSGDSTSEIKDALTNELKSLNKSANINSPAIKSYLISFYTTQNRRKNEFNVQYGNQVLKSSFSKPSLAFFHKDNLVPLAIISILLLIAILFIINLLITKKRISRSIIQANSKREFENKENHILSSESTHSNQTHYGNGSIVPYIIVEIDGDTTKHELKKLRTTIGRHSDNDILIANLTISNHHAAITNEGGIFYIQDQESTNGTFVNDIKISKAAIKSGDSVRIGKAKLYLTY